MLHLLISLIAIQSQFSSKSNVISNGLIIYSYTQNKNNSETNLAGFDLKQPDSVFYSVYFENKFSISYFSPTKSRLYPKDYSFSDFDQFSFNFIDSGFYIKKKLLCKNLFKFPFLKKDVHPTTESYTISGIKCIKYFSVNIYKDTTYFFATNELPKAAGIIMLADFSSCIIGLINKSYTLAPVFVDKTVTYETNKMNMALSTAQSISSGESSWIESQLAEIKKGNPFPGFSAKNILGNKLTEQVFKTEGGGCSILLFLNNIKFCKSYNPALKNYYADGDEQSRILLESLNKVASEKNRKLLVITTDFQENIEDLNYPYLHIIPNANGWFENMKIQQFPLFVIVNNAGIVKDFFSLFGLNTHTSYYESFSKIIETCEASKN